MHRIYTQLLLSFWLFSWAQQGFCQMVQGERDTLYGNEWIREGQRYFKMKVGEDGVYRINSAVLSAVGIPVSELSGSRYQLFWMGREVPLYVSSGIAPLGAADYLEFYGRKNRGELDRFLYADPDREMLNPAFSLFSDTSVYFLSWVDAGASTLRYRDVDNDLSGVLPPKEVWFWDTLLQSYQNAHMKRRLDADNLVTYSIFDEGEGFGSAFAREHQIELRPAAVHAHTEAAQLLINLFSGPGLHRISISINGQEVYTDTLLQPYRLLRLEFPVVLSDPQAPVRIHIRDLNGRNLSIGRILLRYPRRYAFAGEPWAEVQANPRTGTGYYELESFGHQGQAPWVLDIQNNSRLRTVLHGNTVRWSSAPGSFLIYVPTRIQDITQLEPAAWVPAQAFEGDYLILTHPSLMAAAGEYAAYRSSPAGGSYRVSVLHVEQLYDQFAYGVSGHPLGVKNMGNWVTKGIVSDRHLLILGKGLIYWRARSSPQLRQELNLVPCFGAFPSDNLLVSKGQRATPLFAVGRVAATTPQQVLDYLEKVKTHEAGFRQPRTFAHHAWRKHLLHLVGGSASEQPVFASYLNRMAQELERNPFGAATTTVRKTSSDPVAASPTETAVNRFNAGVGIKNFLGHGGVTITDFGLDDPEYFDNEARLPFAVSLGCLSGHIYTSEFSVSERFVLTPRKGAIAYAASCGYAYPFALANVSEKLYQLIGADDSGKTLGQQVQQVRAQFEDYQDIAHRSLIHQFTFQGDPAAKILDNTLPDWVPDPASLRISPSTLNPQIDSFSVELTVANLGRNTVDSLEVLVQHEFQPDSILSYVFRIATPASLISTQFRLPYPSSAPAGAQRLWVVLDPNNLIEEGPAPEAETNNTTMQPNGDKGILVFSSDNVLLPLDPIDNGIWTQPELTLTAFTADIFAQEQDYAFELDTVPAFNSPFKKSYTIRADGGVVSWKPGIALEEDQVYFWRVQTDTVWLNRSFRYAAGEDHVWGQSGYQQVQMNAAAFLEVNQQGEWVFGLSPASVLLQSNVFSVEFNNVFSRVLLNNDRIVNISLRPSLTVVVLDSLRGIMKRNISFNLDQPVRRKQAIDFIRDSIGMGDYTGIVLARNLTGDYFEKQWAADSLLYGDNLFSILEKEGATAIRLLLDLGPAPYAFAFRKGRAPIAEEIGDSESTRVNVFFELPAKARRGSLTTAPFGPAMSWKQFSWFAERGARDSCLVELYGLKHPQSNPELLVQLKSRGNQGIDQIDARTYPFLQAKFVTENAADRKPSQLLNWQAAYTPSPELALDPQFFHNDTLQQGDSVQLSLRIANFSSSSAQGIQLFQRVIGPDNSQDTLSVYLDSLSGYGSTEIRLSASTAEYLPGENRLALESRLGLGVPERTFLNNAGSRAFQVTSDRQTPLLDVTFDGERILHGALVSPNPEIRIALQDENRYLLLQDTQALDVTLIWPDRMQQRIPLSQGRFEAATEATNNQAVFSFQPSLDQEGTYTLRVRARDRSGNLAGNSALEIPFQVIRKSSLSNILPYPNPFSTAARFVYTFTGSSQPENFLLRIMTVSGRIVREVRGEEFGFFKVGTHLSDFVWDGTDQFGERLANGVYLYQVLVKDAQDASWDTYETEADSYFRKGIGKIVLLR